MKSKYQYIWQRKDWPKFTWDRDRLLPLLGAIRKQQGLLFAQMAALNAETQAQFVTDEALTTSAIEGEKLNQVSVRSSVARRLGLKTAGVTTESRNIEGLVEMLLDATQNWAKALTPTRVQGWQASLFPTGFSGMHKIKVGTWRRGEEPMRVISGGIGREIIHYEAPPATQLASEMKQFFQWWQESEKQTDGIIRAGVAHFYFVTLHPFDDGNGRVARAITDMALAQDDKTGIRFYSLSKQILKDKKDYYNILEESQKQTGDITAWLEWFLKLVSDAVGSSLATLQKTVDIGYFWQKHSQVEFNARQRKVLQRLLEAEPEGFEGGMTNKKYVSLTRTSRETAKRDLADLEAKGAVKRQGEGRSVQYVLKRSRKSRR